MSIVLFSSQGIHYQDKSRGPIMAIYVPQLGAIRRFTDVQNNSAKEIAARYGATQEKPIFKVERGQVIVYGLVTPELSQKVEDVSVYLPEQMVPPKCNAFYFVFGTHVVHGIQETDDEGRTEWKVAHLTHPNQQAKTARQKEIDVPLEELVVQQVVASMAERMITADNLEITVAVTGNNKLLKLLQREWHHTMSKPSVLKRYVARKKKNRCIGSIITA